MIRLRIQNGILFKEHVIVPGPDAGVPTGWEPDDLSPEVQARADEIFEGWARDGKFAVRAAAVTFAAEDYMHTLVESEEPVPGWLPVDLGPADEHLRRAYRELFVRLSEGNADSVEGGTGAVYRLLPVMMPDDGLYVYEDGEMRSKGEDDDVSC